MEKFKVKADGYYMVTASAVVEPAWGGIAQMVLRDQEDRPLMICCAALPTQLVIHDLLALKAGDELRVEISAPHDEPTLRVWRMDQ